MSLAATSEMYPIKGPGLGRDEIGHKPGQQWLRASSNAGRLAGLIRCCQDRAPQAGRLKP